MTKKNQLPFQDPLNGPSYKFKFWIIFVFGCGTIVPPFFLKYYHIYYSATHVWCIHFYLK
jgi:hypothetical protein